MYQITVQFVTIQLWILSHISGQQYPTYRYQIVSKRAHSRLIPNQQSPVYSGCLQQLFWNVI